MTQNFPDNTLYEMDNLDVLRGMNSETVDLIATDPPFNTKRNRSATAGHYVDNWKWGDTGILPDQWKWNEVHPKWLEEIKDNHTALYHTIDAARYCQGEDTAAFLCFLSVRLIEMHRILKETGSIYLHCDPTASHYIKMCMDAIFGKKNFRNEIVWCYTRMSAKGQRKLSQAHDLIYWYSKGSEWIFNVDQIRLPYAEGSKNREGHTLNRLGSGYSKEGKTVLNPLGKFPEDWLTHIPYLRGNERTGSPDQKPLALYERIIKASSNEGDLVLDPFCGCATTIIAADNLKRRWVGIDRRIDARYHIITRLMGISKKERERIEKYATDKDWLDRQTAKYEIHYQTDSPMRTDQEEPASPELSHVYQHHLEPLHTHAEMHQILINQFGLTCWGCNFVPPDKRYLHLDHIIPKSDGGTNDINNRALLCQPCNSKKSNTMSLNALRRQNRKEGYTQPNPEINLQNALAWTRNYLIQTIRETPHQLRLNNM
ncbi:hypothetical protein F4X73_16745 [Candidatus Poribacteria bacterium]|nr:hypothetical protein [Candidatus Poribacteria bacterium]MYB66336.1 hypothetical protein [Candidatus Poribacteria bacterium]